MKQDNTGMIQVLDTTREREKKYSTSRLDCKNDLNALSAAQHDMVAVSWSVSDSKNGA